MTGTPIFDHISLPKRFIVVLVPYMAIASIRSMRYDGSSVSRDNIKCNILDRIFSTTAMSSVIGGF